MFSLLPYSIRQISVWLIWLGISMSFLLGFFWGLFGLDCNALEFSPLSYIHDSGYLFFAIGIILFLLSKGKANDEFIYYMRVQAGSIVVFGTVVYSIFEEFSLLPVVYTPKAIVIQSISYFLIFKITMWLFTFKNSNEE